MQLLSRRPVHELTTLLAELHGSTASVSEQMLKLVPFPESLPSLLDADVVDLSINADSTAPTPPGSVKTRVRYTTQASLQDACNFYEDYAVSASGGERPAVRSRTEGRIAFDAGLDNGGTAHCEVLIESRPGYRRVEICVDYLGPSAAETIERYADWHGGNSLFDGGAPIGVEVATFAISPKPETVALFTTHYRWPDAHLTELRRLVDERLDAAGLRYNETQQGILFLDSTDIAEEIHVNPHGHGGAQLSFVGEFPVR